MTVTPAQVAGVTRIVVCSPKPARETLAAAWLAGVTEFYRMGGAQAIGALAYGTQTIGRVDKIVGPGNLYVTAAKMLVSGECGIDMPAGPTEIGVMSENGDPAGIAADLVAQAEHDPESLAVLITPNAELAAAVMAEVKLQSRKNVTAKDSLARQGAIFVTHAVTEAQELTNRLAFEHLSVDTAADVAWVRNAGSVFRRALFAAVHGRLRLRSEPCAAHRPQWPHTWRVERCGFSEGHHRAAIYEARACRS